jgi:thioredoxin-related protein
MQTSKLSRLALMAILLACAGSLAHAAEKDYPEEFTQAVKQGSFVTDYKLALALAKETKRPIFADFTGSDWCGWCVKLKSEVFDTKEFKAWAGEHAIMLEIDFPNSKPQDEKLKAQNKELATQFQVRGFPTVIILNGEGKQLGELGYEAGGPSTWIPLASKAAAIKGD